MPEADLHSSYAALDLGSNSFHLVVAQVHDHEVRVIDKMKEMVRLAGGLDKDRNLNDETRQRAIDCLKRFGQRLNGIPAENVRIVGTNTLRRAKNSQGFISEAEAAIGYPIEIIPGREEARLVYIGVSHTIAPDDKKRLVVDIGGGSTEFIIGTGFYPKIMDSLFMGCVSMSKRFLSSEITREAFDAAVLAARLELEPVAILYHASNWVEAVGSSGTIRAIGKVMQANGWAEYGITKEGLQKLRAVMLDASSVSKLKIAGLSDERKPVFAGGVAVLSAIFDGLSIERMRVSDGALREGVLYDLIGRNEQEDVRENTVGKMMKRYHIDDKQAKRVEKIALKCLRQVDVSWNLLEDELRFLLSWAARLHEIGLSIAHSQYHRHGAYILANSDLPGFARRDQQMLAAIVRGHRRRFPTDEFKKLSSPFAKKTRRLCVLLRLAVILLRGHRKTEIPDFRLSARKSAVEIIFPEGWLEEHTLTRADLKQEQQYLADVGIDLKIA